MLAASRCNDCMGGLELSSPCLQEMKVEIQPEVDFAKQSGGTAADTVLN